MMLSLLLVATGAVYSDLYTQPIEVLQPVRLQITPVVDGTINKEEWDPFSAQTYLQWEPGKIYAAGQAAAGKDLVLSIDGKGDGWLVGRDNIEFRVSIKDGQPVVTCRELDATVVSQPMWRDRKDLQTASMAVVGPTGDVEAVFDGAGLNVLPKARKNLTLRLDLIDSAADSAAYLPRTCFNVRFDDTRSMALPSDMDFGVQARTRSVMPGEEIGFRLNFHGSNKLGLKNIEIRGAGEAETVSNRMSVLFPNFDAKKRAFVDYTTKIDPAASLGYRVLRGSISFADGPESLVETSYRIAPMMDFALLNTDFERLPENNTLRIRYVMQMHTRQAAEGLVKITPPEGWQVIKGDASKFDVLGNQSADARAFDVLVPADAHGTFPIKFTGETKDRTVAQTCYVTIR